MGTFEKEEILGTAIKQAEKNGVELDYTYESVSALEEMLGTYSQLVEEEKFSDTQIWNIAVIFGVYLGETLLKNGLKDRGYDWYMDENNSLFLKRDDGNCMYPLSKVHKRLKEGAEDNVKSFYDVAFLVADGKLK